MLSLHPAYRDFVSGSKTGAGTHFHCLVCKRDVAMGSQGSRVCSAFPVGQSLGQGCRIPSSYGHARVEQTDGALAAK